jgi:hypothetical protein
MNWRQGIADGVPKMPHFVDERFCSEQVVRDNVGVDHGRHC